MKRPKQLSQGSQMEEESNRTNFTTSTRNDSLPMFVAVKHNSDPDLYSRTSRDRFRRVPRFFRVPLRSEKLSSLIRQGRWEEASNQLLSSDDFQKEASEEISLSSNASSSGRGAYPLHLACMARPMPPLSFIRLLLESFPAAARSAEDSFGFLPLHLACKLSPNFNPEEHQQDLGDLDRDDTSARASTHGIADAHAHTHAHASVTNKDSSELGSVPVVDYHFHYPTPPSIDNHCRIISFLVQTYPEAVRIREQFHGMLPIHIVASTCDTGACETLSRSEEFVLELLLNEWPASVRVVDDRGDTPLKIAWRQSSSSSAMRRRHRRSSSSSHHQPPPRHSRGGVGGVGGGLPSLSSSSRNAARIMSTPPTPKYMKNFDVHGQARVNPLLRYKHAVVISSEDDSSFDDGRSPRNLVNLMNSKAGPYSDPSRVGKYGKKEEPNAHQGDAVTHSSREASSLLIVPPKHYNALLSDANTSAGSQLSPTLSTSVSSWDGFESSSKNESSKLTMRTKNEDITKVEKKIGASEEFRLRQVTPSPQVATRIGREDDLDSFLIEDSPPRRSPPVDSETTGCRESITIRTPADEKNKATFIAIGNGTGKVEGLGKSFVARIPERSPWESDSFRTAFCGDEDATMSFAASTVLNEEDGGASIMQEVFIDSPGDRRGSSIVMTLFDTPQSEDATLLNTTAVEDDGRKSSPSRAQKCNEQSFEMADNSDKLNGFSSQGDEVNSVWTNSVVAQDEFASTLVDSEVQEPSMHESSIDGSSNEWSLPGTSTCEKDNEGSETLMQFIQGIYDSKSCCKGEDCESPVTNEISVDDIDTSPIESRSLLAVLERSCEMLHPDNEEEIVFSAVTAEDVAFEETMGSVICDAHSQGSREVSDTLTAESESAVARETKTLILCEASEIVVSSDGSKAEGHELSEFDESATRNACSLKSDSFNADEEASLHLHAPENEGSSVLPAESVETDEIVHKAPSHGQQAPVFANEQVGNATLGFSNDKGIGALDSLRESEKETKSALVMKGDRDTAVDRESDGEATLSSVPIKAQTQNNSLVNEVVYNELSTEVPSQPTPATNTEITMEVVLYRLRLGKGKKRWKNFKLRKPNPFYEIAIHDNDLASEWRTVYRSYPQLATRNAAWEAAAIDLGCHEEGSLNSLMIKLTVWDCHKKGKKPHRLIGDVLLNGERSTLQLAKIHNVHVTPRVVLRRESRVTGHAQLRRIVWAIYVAL